MKIKKPRTYMGRISAADDPNMSLLEWRKLINKLIREYGPGTKMHTDGGYNNVNMVVSYRYRKENGVEEIIKNTE